MSSHGYSFPVDMWAAGIIMYMLLCRGVHPFMSDKRVSEERMRKCELEFSQGFFGDLMFRPPSAEAQALCREMLQLDPAKRIRADTFLECSWIAHYPLSQENLDALRTWVSRGQEPGPDVDAPMWSDFTDAVSAFAANVWATVAPEQSEQPHPMQQDDGEDENFLLTNIKGLEHERDSLEAQAAMLDERQKQRKALVEQQLVDEQAKLEKARKRPRFSELKKKGKEKAAALKEKLPC
jgi:serine/threonine protein kinase